MKHKLIALALIAVPLGAMLALWFPKCTTQIKRAGSRLDLSQYVTLQTEESSKTDTAVVRDTVIQGTPRTTTKISRRELAMVSAMRRPASADSLQPVYESVASSQPAVETERQVYTEKENVKVKEVATTNTVEKIIVVEKADSGGGIKDTMTYMLSTANALIVIFLGVRKLRSKKPDKEEDD